MAWRNSTLRSLPAGWLRASSPDVFKITPASLGARLRQSGDWRSRDDYFAKSAVALRTMCKGATCAGLA